MFLRSRHLHLLSLRLSLPLLVLCSHRRLLLLRMHLHNSLLMLLLLEVLLLRLRLHLHLLLHRHAVHPHLRHLLIKGRVARRHSTGHALLLRLLHSLQYLVSHHRLLLRVQRYLIGEHLRILLLEHLLLRAKMRHRHRIVHRTTRCRRTRSLRHASHHWASLCHLRSRYSRMSHLRHHARSWWSSHMSCGVVLHTCHRMTWASHTRMCLSHAGRERLSHHDRRVDWRMGQYGKCDRTGLVDDSRCADTGPTLVYRNLLVLFLRTTSFLELRSQGLHICRVATVSRVV